MSELIENSNKFGKILLSRNTPVCLVVGASGFLGSHLCDKLLSKNIQVIGTDRLDEAKVSLSEAIENKRFHLINLSGLDENLELERLDYIIIVPAQDLNLKKPLDLFKRLKSRLLLISSIDLYDESTRQLDWLKKIESEIAFLAKEHKLNARILRMGPIFGPRMDFGLLAGGTDPVIRLIQQALAGALQKDSTLEFSTRALYIDDATEVAIKCLLAGATAQKIFDAVAPNPIKVSEIKQILLDPLWYENRDFTPSDLPPWPTPNLQKTINFLNWHPKSKIVAGLRKTLSYFKDNEIEIPLAEKKEQVSKGEWQDENKAELALFKAEKGPADTLSKPSEKQNKAKISFKFPRQKFYLLIVTALITFALIWPIFQLGWGILTFRFQLTSAINLLGKGEFDKSLFAIDQASWGVGEAQAIVDSLEPIRKTGVFNKQFEILDNLGDLAQLSASSAQNTILGIQALYQSLRSISGELTESPKEQFNLALAHLTSADEDLSKAEALINNSDFKNSIPSILEWRVDSLREKLTVYDSLVKKGRAVTTILPEIAALEGRKQYLVLLQNNSELRPTGGFIGSFAKVLFEGGKLKKLEVNDIYAIDGQLKIHVEPPKEIKSDLGQSNYFLRDSNWEPDFPTSARQTEWFYNKETGERVEGVVALDVSAMEDLLSVLGPLDLPDYGEKIDEGNLFEKAISYAEVNFFPGSQSKKSFLTALSQSLFNKLFFLPNQNWPKIVISLGRSLEQKHLSVYLDDPKLFSYILSQNWGGLMPRAGGDEQADFLAPVEANLAANKANYYLDRNYKLDSVIGKDGEISHKLRISYTNRSPSNTFPAGKYKNRMRVYLPQGTKLNRLLWGEKEITKEVESFVDFGRAGYSFLITLEPKEQKTLVLDYSSPIRLEFKDSKATYKLDVIKQAGTLKDPFVWSVTYPIDVKLNSSQAQKIGPQEQTIQTDLSTDKSFKLEFNR